MRLSLLDASIPIQRLKFCIFNTGNLLPTDGLASATNDPSTNAYPIRNLDPKPAAEIPPDLQVLVEFRQAPTCANIQFTTHEKPNRQLTQARTVQKRKGSTHNGMGPKSFQRLAPDQIEIPIHLQIIWKESDPA